MEQGYAILKGWGNPLKNEQGVPIRYDGFTAAENARKRLDGPDDYFVHPMAERYFQPHTWGAPANPKPTETDAGNVPLATTATSEATRPAPGRSLMTIRQASVPFFTDFLKWAEEWGHERGQEMFVRNSLDGMYEIVANDKPTSAA
jgi:hypothetical protein